MKLFILPFLVLFSSEQRMIGAVRKTLEHRFIQESLKISPLDRSFSYYKELWKNLHDKFSVKASNQLLNPDISLKDSVQSEPEKLRKLESKNIHLTGTSLNHKIRQKRQASENTEATKSETIALSTTSKPIVTDSTRSTTIAQSTTTTTTQTTIPATTTIAPSTTNINSKEKVNCALLRSFG